MRTAFVVGSIVVVAVLGVFSFLEPRAGLSFLLVGPLIARGVADMTQRKQAVRRNFPLVGNFATCSS